MRISDWSSDVCSSDLHRRPDSRRPGSSRDGIADPDAQQHRRARRLWPVDRRRARDPGRGGVMAHVLIVEARFYSHLNDMLLDGVRHALDAEGHSHETVTVPGALEEIGRASWRERGGQYV